jgi:hypothetical protein
MIGGSNDAGIGMYWQITPQRQVFALLQKP